MRRTGSPQSFLRAEVKPHNGAPALFIEGEPVFPLFHMNWPLGAEDIGSIAGRGIHLFTNSLPHGWTGIERYDFAAADQATLQWIIVELDDCATDMMQAVRESYAYLTAEGLAEGNK